MYGHVYRHVCRHVYRDVCRHGYGHAYRHVYRHVYRRVYGHAVPMCHTLQETSRPGRPKRVLAHRAARAVGDADARKKNRYAPLFTMYSEYTDAQDFACQTISGYRAESQDFRDFVDGNTYI